MEKIIKMEVAKRLSKAKRELLDYNKHKSISSDKALVDFKANPHVKTVEALSSLAMWLDENGC